MVFYQLEPSSTLEDAMHGKIIVTEKYPWWFRFIFFDTEVRYHRERISLPFDTKDCDELRRGDLVNIHTLLGPVTFKIVDRLFRDEQKNWTLYAVTSKTFMERLEAIQQERKRLTGKLTSAA
ncbi:MAG: hypothetical protein AAB388_00565 [Patescibacteria group bacterium]